ncbi:MAG: hypothetical protein COB76_00910 [Alphaproteobacteria bacterium]|nr:MAG: hypothetical protein COB76_00910 [Alphaproteobacteria bacterium]
MITSSLKTIEKEFNALCNVVHANFDQEIPLVSDLSKDAQMQTDDFALTYPDKAERKSYKNFTFEKDILETTLSILTLKTEFLDYHAENTPVFFEKQEAMNHMKSFELSDDADAWQKFFEVTHKQTEQLSEEFTDFKDPLSNMKEQYNQVANNARVIEWTSSYDTFLRSLGDNHNKLAQEYTLYARYNMGLLISDRKAKRDPVETTLKVIQAALENCGANLEEAKAIQDFLPRSKPAKMAHTVQKAYASFTLN